MKVLDAQELHAGLKRNIEVLNRLESEMQTIENTVKEFTQMEDSLKGQGGEALRNFYSECHLPFIQFFLKFKDSFTVILEQIDSALTSLEPDQSGYIQQVYLEADVELSLNTASDVTVELTNETNAIMDSVSDIVSLPMLNESEVTAEIENAKNHRDQTITDLFEFDYTQANALTSVEKDLKMMSTWIGNIQHLMISGLSDVNFSTPRWNLLTFMSLSNPFHSNQMKLNEILRMSAFKNPQKDLQAFSNGLHQDISKIEEAENTQDELDALYKAIANGEGVVTINHEAIEYMEKHNISTSSPQIGPNGEYVITYEDMRKVLGGNGSGTPDGLAPYTVWAAKFFFEDIGTIVSPDATMDERLSAAAFTFIKPAKVLDNVSDAVSASKKAKNSTEIENIKDNTKGTVKKIDSDTIKNYIRDIEGRTGRELPKNQIEKLKEALRNKEYIKMSPIETAKHRAEFDKVKNKVIKEWEENTGQKWPVYNENVISEKTGKIIRKQGDKYDAHHIIENTFGGEHEWWNMHPAKFPNEHQAGIHGAGSPANTLFKGGSK